MNSLNHFFKIVYKYFRDIKIRSQKVWRKNLLQFGFYEKISESGVSILPPHTCVLTLYFTKRKPHPLISTTPLNLVLIKNIAIYLNQEAYGTSMQTKE